MKALVFSSTKKLIYKTVPKPKLKKNETLIKVLATGICGSDMHAFNGLDKVKKKPPIILGHEVIGINLHKNKYCAINPIISCSKCEYCKKNMEHLCSKLSMIGMTKPIKKNGGFAEFLSIPKSNVLTAPIIYSIPVQLIAYHLAVILGTDVDQPRNLAKSVTVE